MAAAGILRTLGIELPAQFVAGIGIQPLAVTRLMSYIVEEAVALMRVSMAAALSAIPPQPQMPMMPTRSGSTSSRSTRKSTAAEKSSVLMSGEAT